MARIDAPLLDYMHLEFFDQSIFDIPQVPHIILRSEIFKHSIEVEVTVSFHNDAARIAFLRLRSFYFYLEFPITGLNRQLSLLKHFFTQCSPLLSHISRLDLHMSDNYGAQLDQQEAVSWLEFLRPFNAVQVLHVGMGPRLVIQIAWVLGGLSGERAVEVLPTLHTLEWDRVSWVGHLVNPMLKSFMDTRQSLGHPVAIGD
jgi:hypothetical protein